MTHGGVTECPRLIYPFSVIPLLEYLGYLEYFSAVGFYWSFFFFMADDTESAWIAPYLSDERNKWDNHSPKLYSLHSPTDTRIWVDPLLLIRLSSVPSLRFIFLPASLLQETCLSRCEAGKVWETKAAPKLLSISSRCWMLKRRYPFPKSYAYQIEIVGKFWVLHFVPNLIVVFGI